ncbi:MAG TPA: hypothetical protein VII02_14370 [Gemmatimonadaceae bacterium]
MKPGMFLAALGAGALGLIACSHTMPVSGAANPAESVSSSAEPRWTTSIQPAALTHFNVEDSTRDRGYGSAQWSPGDTPTLSRVNLVFTFGAPQRNLSWAILFGTCGSASLPLIPISSFPELEVGAGGRAEVNATLSLEFPTSGTYHVEIYKDRQGGIESLVGCGNLKYVSG